MTITEDDFQFTLAQFLLRNELSETPTIHPRRVEMRKGTIQTKIEKLIREYEENNIEVDIEPYKETIKRLRKMKVPEYDELIEIIVENYTIIPMISSSEVLITSPVTSQNDTLEPENKTVISGKKDNKISNNNKNHNSTSKNIFKNLLWQKESKANDN